MMGFGMGFSLLGLVFMLLFWGGLILLAVWLVRVIFSNNSNNNSSTPRSDKSLNALEFLPNVMPEARSRVNSTK